MKLLSFRTSKKDIKRFEKKLAALLPNEFNIYKKIVSTPTKYYSIIFSYIPEGITITHGYSQEFSKQYISKSKKNFNLKGVFIKNKKTGIYEELSLMFIHDCLQKITIKNPYKFYKMYDFNSMELRNLQAEYFEVENSDKRIVEKILKSLNKNQLSQLNLDETFEIDYEEKLYYPILNMEDGNYIAVDKKGNVYRLNHDHSNQIKKIAANPIDFFKVYKGSKSNLENIMYE